MARNVFVLHEVTDFAPGAFENVVVGDGCIQLGRSGNDYIASGCYTSPAFYPNAFVALIPSWNADTPPGTAVEVQVRVHAGGRWSKWFSFRQWSPYINRSAPDASKDEIVKFDGESIRLINKSVPAQTAQVRIYLYTNDPKQTPGVHLIAVATKAAGEINEAPVSVSRTFEIPAYSCLVRDPSIAERIAVPTAITMMMNRWGADLLPEEVARSMYDNGSGYFGNYAYISAIAGAYGFECYACYSTINMIKKELRSGRAVAAHVRYRAPSVTDDAYVAPACAALPLLETATADSFGHLVVVTGFTETEEGELVHINDPLSPNNEQVAKTVPMQQFLSIYTGLAYNLRPGPKGSGYAKPDRILARLLIEGNKISVTMHGEKLLPGTNLPGDISRSTICYTLSEEKVYASAAQKKFYYISPSEQGELFFDAEAAKGKRFTIYFVGSRGGTWVGEKIM